MDIHEAVIRDLFRAVSGIVVPAARETPARDLSPADRGITKDRGLTEDKVEISAQARSLNAADEEFNRRVAAATPEESPDGERNSDEGSESASGDSSSHSDSNLTKEEREEVEKLKERDQEVRTHEQAHLAAAGQYAKGGPTYEYERGPDNRRYAVGGEVHIDTSKEGGDPEGTIRKAQVIRRASLSPAEPSAQDRLVASKASKMEAEARQEVAEQRREEVQGKRDHGDVKNPGDLGEVDGDRSETADAEYGDGNVGVNESNEADPKRELDAVGGMARSDPSQIEKRMAVRYLSSVMSSVVSREGGGMGSLVDMFA